MRWGDGGETLIIADINQFSDEVLPIYFNHNNYSSFIRQLNMYGFRKENKEKKTKQEEYRHDDFKKDSPENLCKINRKKKGGDEEDGRIKYMDDSRSESDLLMPSSLAPLQLGVDLSMDDLKYIDLDIIRDVRCGL